MKLDLGIVKSASIWRVASRQNC